MFQGFAKDLFYLQAELVDTKMEVAVNKSIDRVIEQITGLKFQMHQEISDLKQDMNKEIHGLSQEMDKRFSAVEHRLFTVETKLSDRIAAVETKLGGRLSAVETKLGLRDDKQKEIRNRNIEYTYKAGWLVLTMVISAMVSAGVLTLHAA
jgi:hypothetical protein